MMKIATMVRSYLPVPRPADMIYAPLDLAEAISEGLTARGHSVTLFGPTGTKIQTRTESLNLRSLAGSREEFERLMSNPDYTSHNYTGLWDLYMVKEMFERARAGEFDLIHLHHPETGLPFANLYPDVPVVYTLHDPVAPWWREVLEMYESPNQFYISISDNQRLPAPDLRYISTVYNGIDTRQYASPTDTTKDDFLLFVGRIVPEKGVKEAIQVAKMTGDRLLIIGPTYPDVQGYFDQYVRPELNERILYLGFMERDQVIKYFQKAKAMLFPVQREEPFGMTMVEAMSCGTPVIALRHGSIPEVVTDGVSGYVVDSLTEMAAAVNRIGEIDPQDCRNHVEQHFSLGHMVNNYIAAFQKVLREFKAQSAPKTHTAPVGTLPSHQRQTVEQARTLAGIRSQFRP
jgi:glycosyltransferase involved in cell wall biosynthesis